MLSVWYEADHYGNGVACGLTDSGEGRPSHFTEFWAAHPAQGGRGPAGLHSHEDPAPELRHSEIHLSCFSPELWLLLPDVLINISCELLGDTCCLLCRLQLSDVWSHQSRFIFLFIEEKRSTLHILLDSVRRVLHEFNLYLNLPTAACLHVKKHNCNEKSKISCRNVSYISGDDTEKKA